MIFGIPERFHPKLGFPTPPMLRKEPVCLVNGQKIRVAKNKLCNKGKKQGLQKISVAIRAKNKSCKK